MKSARGARGKMRTVSWCHVRERQQQAREETAFLDPDAMASRGARILAETFVNAVTAK
jgi:hypothetical protein